MRTSSEARRSQRGSTLVMFTLMWPVLLLLVGLAIDRTMLFIVEAKLSAAVDGAALGAGRLLGTSANTEEIAGEFLTANFPTGYWKSYNLSKSITATTVLSTHTITVNANVTVPVLFMRMFGPSATRVYAGAVATKRDSRIVMVLDRSASMSGTAMTAMLSGATTFTNMFTAGTDELGLVVFGSTAIVAYPTTRPYNSSTSSSGGPDTSFSTASPSMTSEIALIQSAGDTNMADGLSLAYIEIQKAHARDLASVGTDDRQNAIVLFTDGMPTAMSGYFNSPNTPPGNVMKSTSSCTNKTATSTTTTQIIGGMGVLSFGNSSSWNMGLFRLASAANDSTSVATWLGYSNTADIKSLNPTTPITGCTHLNLDGLNGSSHTSDLTDLSGLPAYDAFNNSTTNSAYTNSWIYGQFGTAYSSSNVTSGYHLAIACWNATDNVGKTIRQQTAFNPISIYTIAYTGSGGVDTALLKRLANVQDAVGYNSSQPVGEYIEADSTGTLTAAFSTVASELLRLSK